MKSLDELRTMAERYKDSATELSNIIEETEIILRDCGVCVPIMTHSDKIYICWGRLKNEWKILIKGNINDTEDLPAISAPLEKKVQIVDLLPTLIDAIYQKMVEQTRLFESKKAVIEETRKLLEIHH